MPTLSEENYLKTIYHLSRQSTDKVSVKGISDGLSNNPASVIDMLKKLTDKKLLQYDKFRGAKLTEKGLKIALYVVRKHRLWEVFLLEKLGYKWDEIHEIAEQMEHIKDEELVERLDKFLGFPEYDPHGDPIPKSNGQLPTTVKTLLSEIEVGKTCRVAAVKDTSAIFLQYLLQLSVSIGTKIKVIDKILFDGSMNIQIGKDIKTIVSKKFADSLLVEL